VRDPEGGADPLPSRIRCMSPVLVGSAG
jgi:hypothetical protein